MWLQSLTPCSSRYSRRNGVRRLGTSVSTCCWMPGNLRGDRHRVCAVTGLQSVPSAENITANFASLHNLMPAGCCNGVTTYATSGGDGVDIADSVEAGHRGGNADREHVK